MNIDKTLWEFLEEWDEINNHLAQYSIEDYERDLDELEKFINSLPEEKRER